MAKTVKFDLFRLSLRKREQVDIFEQLSGEIGREEWLRTLFSRQVTFRHYSVDYTFQPTDPSEAHPIIIGRIGRQVVGVENQPPEKDFLEYEHEAWKAAVLVLDPTDHSDGQKLALQHHSEVGNPQALVPRLIQALEEDQEFNHFLTSSHPITNKEAFWDFVRRNKGKVVRLTFELEVPNMFGSDDEYEREMKAYREKEKAQRVKVEISNPDGVDPDTERVKYTVDKAMDKGTGKVTARAKGAGNVFSSQKKPQSAKLEHDPDSSLIEKAPLLIDRILGREQD